MVCAGSTSLSISGPSTQRLAGQIRPVKPFHPAAIRLLELMCNSLCGLYQKLWRALVYMNWMGQLQTPQQGCHCWAAGRTVCVLRTKWCCIRGSSQQGLQHTFDRFSAACDQAGTKISTKKVEVLCLAQGVLPGKTPKAVFPASERKNTAAGGDVQVPWNGIHEWRMSE